MDGGNEDDGVCALRRCTERRVTGGATPIEGRDREVRNV